MPFSKLLLAGLAVAGLSACAAPMTFQTQMTGANEVPPVATQGVGVMSALVFPSTRAMTYKGEFKNLSGPATAAHFHGPAAPGANAPVAVPVTDLTSPITGGATLTDQQLADLQAGKMYFNIHTAANPGGEIRGQMVRVQ